MRSVKRGSSIDDAIGGRWLLPRTRQVEIEILENAERDYSSRGRKARIRPPYATRFRHCLRGSRSSSRGDTTVRRKPAQGRRSH